MRLNRPTTARQPGWLARYGFAALSVLAVMAIVRIPVIGRELAGLVFLAFFLSAWYGGLGPGLFATVLFQVLGAFILLYIQRRWMFESFRNLATVFLVGVGFSFLVESLHRARRRVEASRQWLSAVLTSIGDAVIATDETGRVIFMNPVAESLCGWSAASAAGRPLDEVFTVVDERTRQPVESPVARVLAEGVVLGLANRTVLLARDGTERPVDDTGAPIRGAGGDIEGVVLAFRDVTEQRLTEHRLAEESQRKDEFLAMLAHELRNPLAAVSNAVHLLARPEAVEMHGWSREVVMRQVRQLTRLVDDLLDVSRISRGKIHLRPQRVDLAVLVRSAAEVVRPLIDERGHELRLTLASETMELEADPVRLEQVLVNLLNNAAKYTEPGGRIELEVTREPGQTVVRVADTGIGILPEALPRIFDLFTQGDRALNRSNGGLGIGLSMVHKLVGLHGGRVDVRSDGPGRGSEFTIRLPAPADSKSVPEEGGRGSVRAAQGGESRSDGASPSQEPPVRDRLSDNGPVATGWREPARNHPPAQVV